MRYCFLRFPEGRPKALTFSYDDGCMADARMAKTLTQHGMKGTFNLNAATLHAPSFALPDEQIKELIVDAGHEIAVHGALHRAPGAVSTTAGIRDVLNCRIELESRFGRIVRGMAYPDSGIRVLSNGTDYEGIRSYLRELGIVYSRTLGADNDTFLLPTDWYAWMPTAHHNNPALFEMAEKFCAIDFSALYTSHRYPRLFYLWGHSYEFDRKDNWDVLEKFCRTMGGREDTWYATNIEIYEYAEAFRSLVWSADESMVYNPTLKTLWMDVDGKAYTVAPDQTLHF